MEGMRYFKICDFSLLSFRKILNFWKGGFNSTKKIVITKNEKFYQLM